MKLIQVVSWSFVLASVMGCGGPPDRIGAGGKIDKLLAESKSCKLQKPIPVPESGLMGYRFHLKNVVFHSAPKHGRLQSKGAVEAILFPIQKDGNATGLLGVDFYTAKDPVAQGTAFAGYYVGGGYNIVGDAKVIPGGMEYVTHKKSANGWPHDRITSLYARTSEKGLEALGVVIPVMRLRNVDGRGFPEDTGEQEALCVTYAEAP